MAIKVGSLFADLSFVVKDDKLQVAQKQLEQVKRTVEASNKLVKASTNSAALVSAIDMKKAVDSQLISVRGVKDAYAGISKQLVSRGQSEEKLLTNKKAYLTVMQELSKVKHPLDVQKGLFGGGHSNLAKASKELFGNSATIAGKNYGNKFRQSLLTQLAAHQKITPQQLLNVSKVSGTIVKGTNTLRGNSDIDASQLKAFRAMSTVLDKEVKLAKSAGYSIDKAIEISLAKASKHFDTYTANMQSDLAKANKVLSRHKSLFDTFSKSPKAATVNSGFEKTVQEVKAVTKQIKAIDKATEKSTEEFKKYSLAVSKSINVMKSFGASKEEIHKHANALKENYKLTKSISLLHKNTRKIEFGLQNNVPVDINPLNKAIRLSKVYKGSLNEAIGLTNKFSKTTDVADKKIFGINTRLRKLGSSLAFLLVPLGNVNSSIFHLTSMFSGGSLAGNVFAFAMVGIAKAVIFAGRAMSDVRLKLESHMKILEAINGGKYAKDLAAKSFKYATKMANKYGLSLESVLKPLAKLKLATSSLYSNKLGKFKDFFSDLTAVSGNLAHTPEQFARVTKAYEQFFSKGTIGMEELRQQLGDVVPFAITAALNVYTRKNKAMFDTMRANLKDFDESKIQAMFIADMRKGRLSSKEYAPAIAKESLNIIGVDKSKDIDTLSSSYARLITAQTLFWDSLDRSTGFTDKISDVTKGITAMLNSTSAYLDKNRDSFKNFFTNIGQVARKTMSFISTLTGKMYGAIPLVAINEKLKSQTSTLGSYYSSFLLANKIGMDSLFNSNFSGLNDASEVVLANTNSLLVAENKFAVSLTNYLDTIDKYGVASKEGKGIKQLNNWAGDIQSHIDSINSKVQSLKDARVELQKATRPLIFENGGKPSKLTQIKINSNAALIATKKKELADLKNILNAYGKAATKLTIVKDDILNKQSSLNSAMTTSSTGGKNNTGTTSENFIVKVNGIVARQRLEITKLNGGLTAHYTVMQAVKDVTAKYKVEAVVAMKSTKAFNRELTKLKDSARLLATTKFKVKFDSTINASNDRFKAYKESEELGKQYDKLVKIKKIRQDLLNQASGAYPNQDKTGVVDNYMQQQEYIAKSSERIRAAREEANAAKKAMDAYKATIDTISEPIVSLGGKFFDLAASGKASFSTLSDAVRTSVIDIAKQISMMILKLSIVKPLLDSMGGYLGLKPSAAAGGSSSSGDVLSSLVSSGLSSIGLGGIATKSVNNVPNKPSIDYVGSVADPNTKLVAKARSLENIDFNESTRKNVSNNGSSSSIPPINVVVNITGGANASISNEVAKLKAELPGIILSTFVDARNKRRI